MSQSLNECNFIGNLTRDPEIRYTSGGAAVADIGIAVNDSYKKDDEWIENTVFINCQAWNKNAERIAAQYKKGDRILVKTKLKIDNWEDKTSGEKRTAPKFTIFQDWPLQRVGKAVNTPVVSDPDVRGNVEDDEDMEDIPF